MTASTIDDRYELVDPLGFGGMAVVWRARDRVLGRLVALKLLNGRHSGQQTARRRIRDEARAAAGLSHPNIAQVYDYGEWATDGQLLPYVVMELVRGTTLQRRMEAGPLPARFAMRVGAEVAAALAAAHSEGLVHRDIKPANVMLPPEGAKVVDFGIAAATRPDGEAPEPETDLFGTPGYLAPERLTGDSVEPASDVYALGVLLYRMLSGESPWAADSTTQMLQAHVHIEPVPLPELPGVPGFVTELSVRMLSKDPTMRPSAREVAALLGEGAGLRIVTDVEPAAGFGGPSPEPSLLIRRSTVEEAVRAAPAPEPEPPTLEPTESGAVLPGSGVTPATTVAGAPDPAPADLASAGPAAHDLAPSSAGDDGIAPPGPAPSDAASTGPTGAGNGRRRWLVSAMVLVAIAGLLAAFVPWNRSDAGRAAPGLPDGTGSPSVPVRTSPPSVGPTSPTVAPTRTTRPAAAAPGGPTTTATRKPTTPPSRTPTSKPPTTTKPPQPQTRTLESAGGSVRATCPEPTIAQLLSWTAKAPYEVRTVVPGPRAKTGIQFRNGQDRVRMVITCAKSVPSASVRAN